MKERYCNIYTEVLLNPNRLRPPLTALRSSNSLTSASVILRSIFLFLLRSSNGIVARRRFWFLMISSMVLTTVRPLPKNLSLVSCKYLKYWATCFFGSRGEYQALSFDASRGYCHQFLHTKVLKFEREVKAGF